LSFLRDKSIGQPGAFVGNFPFLALFCSCMKWFYLTVAIVCEVIATSALKSSNAFTRLVPSLIVIAGYVTAFYFLSLALKFIPIGVAYAIWCGIGIVLISFVGIIFFRQALDMPAVVGITLIGAGVMVLCLLSKCTGH